MCAHNCLESGLEISKSLHSQLARMYCIVRYRWLAYQYSYYGFGYSILHVLSTNSKKLFVVKKSVGSRILYFRDLYLRKNEQMVAFKWQTPWCTIFVKNIKHQNVHGNRKEIYFRQHICGNAKTKLSPKKWPNHSDGFACYIKHSFNFALKSPSEICIAYGKTW